MEINEIMQLVISNGFAIVVAVGTAIFWIFLFPKVFGNSNNQA